ncbi:MAG: asparagine synthase (glutamine-hydrolyzing), partial [Bdellovibrionales bacterium]|nr:asparagine synthase (glutamine-hydrolyzing) [Bdellovibrionales bacterium]
MCGIAGYTTIGSDREIDPRFIDPMIQSIYHRGPDECGTLVDRQIAMGNSRLSIIDLAGGKQPISNSDNTIHIVYNGELYNAPELTRELKSKGYVFRTKTDTEVLVHLYEEEGEKFVSRLNGMFAFCIYDERKDQVMIGRDRFGVKPLVYSYQNGTLLFGSELKSLKIHPDFDATLDPQGISTFLGLFYIPDPWTIYKNVKKLRPGHYLTLSKSGLKDVEYFDYSLSKKINISLREAEDQTAFLLRQSIERQLLSDVPVGVLLSGGLDSRSVLAAASAQNPNTDAFTITFSESIYNEGGEAGYWARAFSSAHHSMLFTEEDFLRLLMKRQAHLDEPYALWCNVAT